MKDILKWLSRVVFLQQREGFIYRNVDHKSRQIVCVMSKPYCEIFSYISFDSYNNLTRLVLLLIILPVMKGLERLCHFPTGTQLAGNESRICTRQSRLQTHIQPTGLCCVNMVWSSFLSVLVLSPLLGVYRLRGRNRKSPCLIPTNKKIFQDVPYSYQPLLFIVCIVVES